MMPSGIRIIDTYIGFNTPSKNQGYSAVMRNVKGSDTDTEKFPAGYMFKDPVSTYTGEGDPVDLLLAEMDKYNIDVGVVGLESDEAKRALKQHPSRFVALAHCDPTQSVDALRGITRDYEAFNIRGVVYSGMSSGIAINDKLMYPIYAKCCELGIAAFIFAGVPGPRLKLEPQKVEYLDEVMYDFPELTLVTRHGCEPWTDLMVKLMLKWPGLYYSTSAFAPKHYNKDIIEYANTRGADKVIYAGYYPDGLTLERIMSELPLVPFRDHVWPKFLRENAAQVLKIA